MSQNDAVELYLLHPSSGKVLQLVVDHAGNIGRFRDGFPAEVSVGADGDWLTVEVKVAAATAMSRSKLTAGATGWIVKPFAQDKLIRALRTVAG